MASTTSGDRPDQGIAESAWANDPALRKRAIHAIVSCYLGWTLDAFDFFIMVFVFDEVARTFGVSEQWAAFAVTATLACRVFGAFVFGRIADRYGRRLTLMINIFTYAALEFLSGVAPTFWTFMILRALYGVAMGGEWGIGASLALESVPAKWRGIVSGMLQSGYPCGYLLASLLFYFEPYLGFFGMPAWRGMFIIGALPAFLVLYIRSSVDESPDWQAHAERGETRIGFFRTLTHNLPLALFCVVMMTGFNFFSHGSQDGYPKLYLAQQRHLSHDDITLVMVIANIGAMIGGVVVGLLSQRIGRKWAIVLSCVLAWPAIAIWAWTDQLPFVALGAFLLQICVQGAWGVVPAYLNEVSPAAIRATFPGTVYQIGNFAASFNLNLQVWLKHHFGGDMRYGMTLVVAAAALVIAATVLIAGRDTRNVRMGRDLLE